MALSFEDLQVWHDAVGFAEQCLGLVDKIESARHRSRLLDQLERSCTSVALNIAEGKGRYSKKEFVQFLFVARGSLFETVALAEILVRRGWISRADLQELRLAAANIGRKIGSLIRSIRA